MTAVAAINTALALPLLALGLQELPELQIRSPFKPHVLVPGREGEKKKNLAERVLRVCWGAGGLKA